MKAMTYFELIRTIHDQVPSYVSFLLMLKLDMTENNIFYFISFFLRFNGILILCSKFHLTIDEVKNNKSLATYLRYLTVNSIKALFKTNHISYIVICLIFFVLFFIRIIFYYLTINQLKNSTNLEKIKTNRYQVFMDHIVFLFYPLLLEYLFQMHLRFMFPHYYSYGIENYLIVDIIILVFNTILIIGYNINNYYHLHVINRPTMGGKVPVRYRFSKKKFWAIFLLQNIACIQNLDNYLTSDRQVKYFTIIIAIVFCIIFFLFFITSLAAFNYDVPTNHFLAIMSNYCFFSLFSEAIVRILGYKITADYTLIMFNIVKILISILFVIINNRLSDVKLLSLVKEELFKIYSSKIDNEEIYDVFLYIYEILKIIKSNKENIASSTLINMILEHQNSCSIKTCKCKLIQIMPEGEQYNENFTYNFIQRITFFIETAFIQVDYSSDYHLTLMFAEHFSLFRNNLVLGFSLLQTLIQFNIHNLKMSELLTIYETCQKYVMIAIEMDLLSAIENEDRNFIIKGNLFKEKFALCNLIYDIQKMMLQYCNQEIEIAKYKEMFEDSAKIQKNEETGVVSSININFLNSKNIDKIINLLKKETILNEKMKEKIISIKSKLPIEFYYKCFLFYKTFLEGKLDEKIVSILYSFTNDRNLYSTKINPNIFILLRQRYIESINNDTTVYYTIFNFSKGTIISFYSEALAYKLGYSHNELIGQNIDILLPKQIAKLHDYAVLHYLIAQQNRIMDNYKNSMFNKNGLMVESRMSGASLPGLGKNLLAILGIKIVHNDNLRIYFTQNFELISLSESFYNKFYFDMDIIEKFNLNILRLFGLDPKDIKEKFLNFESDIRKLKLNLNVSTEEFFMRKLFKQSHLMKYELLKELENQYKEETNKLHKNQQIIKDMKECLNKIYNNKFKDQIKPRSFKYKIPKNEIIKNFNKILNEENYGELNDKGYKKIADFITNLQKIFINEEDSINKSYYEITVQCKLMYVEPIFHVNIHEYHNFIENKAINNQNTNLNILYGKNNIINNDNIINKNSLSNNNTTMTQKTTMTINNTNVKVVHGPKKDENNSRLLICTKNIIYCVVIILLIVYIIILWYQLNFINNCYTLFLAYFYNCMQKNKAINLHSILLLNYYRETNLTDLNVINETEFMDYIINSAKQYEEAYHEFYQYYLQFHFRLGKHMTIFYNVFNVSRVSINWNVKSTTSIFMKEAESIIHSIITFAKEKVSKQNLIHDLNIFFDGAYNNNVNKNSPIYSSFISILFYFCENFENKIYNFINLIENKIMNSYNDYVEKSERIYIFIETLGCIVNIVLGAVVFIFLVLMNRMVFRNIVELFIDYTQEGNYSFKNNLDNYLFIEKMNELKYLFFNFNIKSLDNYNKKISQKSLELLECNDGGTMNSLEKSNENSPPRNSISKNVINDKKIINNNNEIAKNINVLNKEGVKNLTNDYNNTSLTNTNKTDMSSSIINSLSKTNDKLLNFNNYNKNNVNLISNLNKILPAGNNAQSLNSIHNMNTKNSLVGDSSLSTNSINIQNNNNKSNEVNVSLPAIKVSEKVAITKINFLKLNMILIVGITGSFLIYYIIKVIITWKFIKNITNIFNDYGLIATKFGIVENYFNNFCLLLINKNLVNLSYFDDMLEKTHKQDISINEVRIKRLSNYPSACEMITKLNRKQNEVYSDGTNLEDTLCENSVPCHKVLEDENLTMVTNGVDLAASSIIQEIEQLVNDYKKINKNDLTDLTNIKKYFINVRFIQISFNLNFVLSTTVDRVEMVFLEDTEDMTDSYKKTIILTNIIIIAYFSGGFLFVIYLTSKTFKMKQFIEASISRLNKVFCYIKEVNKGYIFRTTTSTFG